MYYIPLEKLDLLKNTLYKYLNRGFIVLNKITYTLLVLFTFKLNGGWRFCVDYRKLNRIIKKDKYLLPLINKTFRRIIRAKVFTKLNIWYVFHCICMYLDLKELIAFGTRYKAY